MRQTNNRDRDQAWAWLRSYARENNLAWENVISDVHQAAPRSQTSAVVEYVSLLKKKIAIAAADDRRRTRQILDQADALISKVFPGITNQTDLREFLMGLLFEELVELVQLVHARKGKHAKRLSRKKGIPQEGQ